MPVLSVDESVVRAAHLNPTAVMKVLLRGLVTAIFGGVGCVIFGIVGSMGWPGYGAIVGALTGLLLFTVFGCFISGFYGDVFSAEKVHKSLHAGHILPHSVAKNFNQGHGHFTLDVTVVQSHDVTVGGVMAMVRSNPYVEVHCGSNPVKRTCVDPAMKWNETFRLKVGPHDAVVKLSLYDQDLFGVTELGEVTLDIERDIMARLPDRHPCECVRVPADKTLNFDFAKFNHSFERNDPRFQCCRPHKFKIGLDSNSIVSKKPMLELAFEEVQYNEESRFITSDDHSPLLKTYGTMP